MTKKPKRRVVKAWALFQNGELATDNKYGIIKAYTRRPAIEPILQLFNLEVIPVTITYTPPLKEL